MPLPHNFVLEKCWKLLTDLLFNTACIVLTSDEEIHITAKFSVHVDEKILSLLHCILLRKMDDFLLDAQPRAREIMIT
jgi:hypothetical protein